MAPFRLVSVGWRRIDIRMVGGWLVAKRPALINFVDPRTDPALLNSPLTMPQYKQKNHLVISKSGLSFATCCKIEPQGKDRHMAGERK